MPLHQFTFKRMNCKRTVTYNRKVHERQIPALRRLPRISQEVCGPCRRSLRIIKDYPEGWIERKFQEAKRQFGYLRRLKEPKCP